MKSSLGIYCITYLVLCRTLESDLVFCGKKEGEVSELTLSTCFPGKYTCDSGHCIELSSKCNTEIDCDDK